MTLFRRHACFVVTAGLLFIGLAWTNLRGETASHGLKIFGTIVDGTQDFSEEDSAKLERVNSQEEFERVLGEVLGERPPPIAVVTAQGWNVRREVLSDSKGKFTFTDLPKGIYEVSAKTYADTSRIDGKRMVSVKRRVRVVENNGIVRLALHEELIAVSGRITDIDGKPIVGAKVTGTAVPVREAGLIDRGSAGSGPDGSYELQGFAPLDLYRIAGYLNGGDLEAPGSLYTCVEIRVDANGFVHLKQNVPKVPLVTETQLVPARRLWKALSKLAKTMGEGEGWQKMKERPLPSSHRNTITDVDIVLDRPRSETHSDPDE